MESRFGMMRIRLMLSLAGLVAAAAVAAQGPPPPATGSEPTGQYRLLYQFRPGGPQRFTGRITGRLELNVEPALSPALAQPVPITVDGTYSLTQQVTGVRNGVATIVGRLDAYRIRFSGRPPATPAPPVPVPGGPAPYGPGVGAGAPPGVGGYPGAGGSPGAGGYPGGTPPGGAGGIEIDPVTGRPKRQEPVRYEVVISLNGSRTARRFAVRGGGVPLDQLIPLLLTPGSATVTVGATGQARSSSRGPTILLGSILPPTQPAQLFGSGVCGLVNIELPAQPVSLGETWDTRLTRKFAYPVTVRGRRELREIPFVTTTAHTLVEIADSGGRRVATIQSEGSVALGEGELRIGETVLREASHTFTGQTVLDLARGQIQRSSFEVLLSSATAVPVVVQRAQRDAVGDPVGEDVKAYAIVQLSGTLRYTLTPVRAAR